MSTLRARTKTSAKSKSSVRQRSRERVREEEGEATNTAAAAALSSNQVLTPAPATSSLQTTEKARKEFNAAQLANIETLETMNSSNVKKIDRDSLYCVLSYLDFNDWKQHQMWLVCQWWYHTMKKSHRPLGISYEFPSKGWLTLLRRNMKASPLFHHVTHLTCKATFADLTFISSLSNIEELTLTILPPKSDLSPLLTMTKLTNLTIWKTCSLEDLTVIKQLPALTIFQQGYQTMERHHQRCCFDQLPLLTCEPTRIAQWHLLDVSGDDGKLYPEMVNYVLKFTSLRYLDFGGHQDPAGKLAQLQQLEELTLGPRYLWGRDESTDGPFILLGNAYGGFRKRRVSKLKLKLGTYFQRPLRHIQCEGGADQRYPILEDATKQLMNMFHAANDNIMELQIHYAFTLTDLSCLASLSSLRSLLFAQCWMIDSSSVRQLSVLTRLEELTIVLDFEITDQEYARFRVLSGHLSTRLIVFAQNMKQRYEGLESLCPELTPPSSLIPSLRSFQLLHQLDVHQQVLTAMQLI